MGLAFFPGVLNRNYKEKAMKPAQEMLNRIRWDQRRANDEFSIGYYDRVERRVIIVPFREIHFPQDDHFSFVLVDQSGEPYPIPYHRVKANYRNGRLIWQRNAG